jgi:hypothetical protein
MNLNDLIISCFTTDNNGNVALRTTGISGGSGSLTLVETKIITSSNQTITFSDLDGNTDGVYRLIAKLISSAGTAPNIELRPNGATTNLSSSQHYIDNGIAGISSQTKWLAGFQKAGGGTLMLVVDIFAEKDVNSVASAAFYNGTWSSFNNTGIGGYIGGRWNETATNITSLEIRGDQANCINSGSKLSLYKYTQ